MKERYAIHKQSGILERECVLCGREPIEEFQFWKIIPNQFPYDLIAKEHQMLVPKRHVIETLLNAEELQEMFYIKANHLAKYDHIIEAVGEKNLSRLIFTST